MLKEKAKPCSELSEKVLNEMCSDGYSAKSVEHHVRPIYNRLAEYCEEHFEGMYSVDAGKAFLQMVQREKQSKEQTALNRNTVERLDHALGGDFHWRPAKSKLKPYASSCYDAVVARYEAYLIQTGKTIANTRHHMHLISGFLAYMESIGVSSLPMIKAEHIHERFIAANDKAGFRKAVKMFFRYACRYGLIENDISHWIPSVPRHKPVPSVLSTQGIHAVVSGAIARAGMDMSSRRHGAHALRSSLASHLLAEGKSCPEIRQVSGQTSPDADRHYIRVEAERLRGCAIGVPFFPDELITYFRERR